MPSFLFSYIQYTGTAGTVYADPLADITDEIRSKATLQTNGDDDVRSHKPRAAP